MNWYFIQRSLHPRYSFRNCIFTALGQRVKQKCGCDYFFEQKKTVAPICYGENYTCFRQVVDKNDAYDVVGSDGSVKQCLPACHQQRNSFFATSARHPNLHLRKPTFCTIVSKISSSCNLPFKAELMKNAYGEDICSDAMTKEVLNKTCQDIMSVDYFMTLTDEVDQSLVRLVLQYAEDNVLAITFYFSENLVTRLVKDENLNIIWYIAAIGGILGLCMGASVITFFEILWHSCRMCGVCKARTLHRLTRVSQLDYVTVT